MADEGETRPPPPAPLRLSRGPRSIEVMVWSFDDGGAVVGPRPADAYPARDFITTVRLEREPSNRDDRNAVQVWHDVAGKVGYVNRHDAERIAPRLDDLARQGVRVCCTAKVHAQWLEDDEPIVNMDLITTDDLRLQN